MGVFIFQGLGQFAMDMVLMGTLPVVAMALAIDAAFGSLARALTPRGLRIAGSGGGRAVIRFEGVGRSLARSGPSNPSTSR